MDAYSTLAGQKNSITNVRPVNTFVKRTPQVEGFVGEGQPRTVRTRGAAARVSFAQQLLLVAASYP
jgi:hypothetical protein